MADSLVPLNDFVVFANIPLRNTTTGALEYATTGTVTGFLATSADADATAAHASLSVSGTQVGSITLDNGETLPSAWMFQIDAAVLTKSLLDTHFAPSTRNPCYFIVSRASAKRQVLRLEYKQFMEAIVE